MIAALPMYDLPGLRADWDALWQDIRDRLPPEMAADAPDRLARGGDPWGDWQSPDLLLSQTCGLPFRARLRARVTLVAAPDHRLPGCAPGQYCSVLLGRAGATLAQAATGRFAFNEGLSESGWAAPLRFFGAPLPFAALVQTGSHAASARAVLEGAADLAALDAQSWRLLQREDPDLDGLRVLARTAPAPALPFVTAAGRAPEPLARALAGAIAAQPADRQDRLGLYGIAPADAAAYCALPLPPAPAETGLPTVNLARPGPE